MDNQNQSQIQTEGANNESTGFGYNPTIPTIDAIHRDIEFANQYRIELIKILLTIAAALFAFTVTFRPSLSHINLGSAMWIGWLGLTISMIGGMVHMHGWDHYYKSYRDFNWNNTDPEKGKEEGKAARKKINRWRRCGMYCQFSGFVIGVAAIGVFSAANIDNAQKTNQSLITCIHQQSTLGQPSVTPTIMGRPVLPATTSDVKK